MINKIIAETGVKIDIEEDGRVYILTPDSAAAQKALRIIQGIAKDIEPGEVYLGKVVRITTFGAFVEILPGKEGLVHISKLDKKRVEKVEDVVNIGDEILVKVTEIDKQEESICQEKMLWLRKIQQKKNKSLVYCELIFGGVDFWFTPNYVFKIYIGGLDVQKSTIK